MSLSDFQSVFDRDDFAWISYSGHLQQLQVIIRRVKVPDGLEDTYKGVIITYIQNLSQFYAWVGGNGIAMLRDGFGALVGILTQTSNLLAELPERRSAISSAMVNKWEGQFWGAVQLFVQGLEKAFDPDLVGETGIGREQIARYILDKVVGLGRKYNFNSRGYYSFARHIFDLNRAEVMITARLLVRPSKNQIRAANDYLDLGARHALIRILLDKAQQTRVLFIYTRSEHRAYETQLQVPIGRVEFEAA